MLFGDFFEAHVERAKPRLDCAGCSETWVGPSRKSSEIEEKTEVLLMLSPHSLFRRNVLEKVLQMDPFGDLGAPFCRSGGPLGAQRLPKVVEKVDQMRLRNRPWQPGGPECYPNGAQGCPGPRKRSPRGRQMARMLPKWWKTTPARWDLFNSFVSTAQLCKR